MKQPMLDGVRRLLKRLANWLTKGDGLSKYLERFAVLATTCVGSSWAFVFAFVMVVAWLASGPFYHYSDTWQLVMNTITSIVTFLMVFLLQRSQNKDTLAMQIKLNELIAAQRGASNRLINVEDLSEEEVRDLHRRYQELADRLRLNGKATSACSIDQSVKPSQGSRTSSPPRGG